MAVGYWRLAVSGYVGITWELRGVLVLKKGVAVLIGSN